MIEQETELTVGQLKAELSRFPDDATVKVALHQPDYEKQTIGIVGIRQVHALDASKKLDVIYIGAMKNLLDEGLFA